MIPPVLAKYKSKGKTPDWLPYIKKWWIEEGPNLPLMIHFWQLVVRHSDVFYPCRSVSTPCLLAEIYGGNLGFVILTTLHLLLCAL